MNLRAHLSERLARMSKSRQTQQGDANSVEWPSHLVERIARDRWVLFLGSGVSSSCRNTAGKSPPTWSALLAELCGTIRDGEAKSVGEGLIASRQLLAAADHIRHVLASEANLGGYFKTIRAAADGPADDKYVPSSLFDALLALDPKVVFTTNYDKLFENASRNGFAVHRYDSSGLSHDLRQGEPVLVKLHGSTDAINDIILTRTDYVRVGSAGREVFEALGALSLTSTILFVGYSLDDPDIQLVLQAVGRAGLSPEAHFMLSPEHESPARIPVFKESFGVSVLCYPREDHSKAEIAISELGNLVLATRAGMTNPNP